MHMSIYEKEYIYVYNSGSIECVCVVKGNAVKWNAQHKMKLDEIAKERWTSNIYQSKCSI